MAAKFRKKSGAAANVDSMSGVHLANRISDETTEHPCGSHCNVDLGVGVTFPAPNVTVPR